MEERKNGFRLGQGDFGAVSRISEWGLWQGN